MPDSLDPIINLAKRRGFYFQSSDIYGGAGGVFDLGPLGVELSNNIKQRWWKKFVQSRDDMVGIDAAILTLPAVLKASGHVDSFTDPLIECMNCHIRLRADHYLEEPSMDMWVRRFTEESARQHKHEQPTKKEQEAAAEAMHAYFEADGTAKEGISEKELVCPNCGERGQFTEPRTFNMMFKTQLGAVAGEAADMYLRPETAQGIFVNFKNVLDTSRKKLPFGIAQIGKAFRNEITVGNSLFRVRELEQMEIEYFVKPGTDEEIHEHWIQDWEDFTLQDLGLKKENIRHFEHPKEKLSHYSKRTVDLEYAFPFGGFGELNGIANRTDFDLSNHQTHSGKDMTYFDEETRERFLPFVIEPTMGVGRAMLAVLCDAYVEYPQGRDGQGSEMESVLHIAKHLAPIKVAILPLMKKDGLAEKAKEIYTSLRGDYMCQYDESGAVGRRYRRQDEIGTPYCVTIDYQTLEDHTVTVRDRDTMEQKRVAIADLKQALVFE